MKKGKKIRVLVAKPGLDGHDRGAEVVAAALRDAGFEVIYTGLHQTCEMVVNAALQEDVDAVCVSILSGAHMTLLPEIRKLMEKNKMDDVLLCGGGIIPDEDAAELKKLGVRDAVVAAALRANMRCPRSPIPPPRFLRHGLIVPTARGPRYHYYGSRRARGSVRPNGYFRYAVRRFRY